MANTATISLTSLDFTDLKTSLQTYLQNQDIFSDYDFSGSNMNVLLDILTYNTYHNAFYLNQVASEGFLDSAKLRDSIVSHAKELNYTPRSFTSAQATINLTIVSSDSTKTSITIPKGTSFTGKSGANNYTFTTNENVVVMGSGTFVANNINVFEGTLLTESFSSGDDIIIKNPQIDTNSLSVFSIEDSGANTLEYLFASSLFGYDSSSFIYFIQAAQGGNYQVIFGDDVVGRTPKTNSIIVVEYRISNGELPNGIFTFTPMGAIDGETNIVITVSQSAHSGTVAESDDSIKFNAPRHFTTQERAVTTEDYEDLLKLNYPEINTVIAFGGEDQTPPVYGKVFISVDLNDIDGVPESKADEYFDFIKSRSPLSIDPVFVDPQYLYIQVNTDVSYNINLTDKALNDIRTIVISSVLSYANNNLDGFAKTLRYSRLLEQIDNSDNSVISNETSVKAIKNIDTVNLSSQNILIDLGFSVTSISSSTFFYKGVSSSILDDGAGSLQISSVSGLTNIGTIDYTSGQIELNSFIAENENNLIRIIIDPQTNDITSSKNTIINIIDSDITVNVIATRL